MGRADLRGGGRGERPVVVSDNTRDYPPEGAGGQRGDGGGEYLSEAAFLTTLHET